MRPPNFTVVGRIGYRNQAQIAQAIRRTIRVYAIFQTRAIETTRSQKLSPNVPFNCESVSLPLVQNLPGRLLVRNSKSRGYVGAISVVPRFMTPANEVFQEVRHDCAPNSGRPFGTRAVVRRKHGTLSMSKCRCHRMPRSP